MIWIEILGPSGVGKSYGYQEFIDKYPEFEPRQLVLNRIYVLSEYKEISFKYKLMFWIFRMNIYRLSNHFKHKLFNYFYLKFERKSIDIYTVNDEKIIRKYLNSINQLNEPHIVVLKKISYFHQKLKEFKFFQYYLEKDDIYIAEDGLMHLAPVYIEEFKPDKILLFKKDYKNLEEQRLKRAEIRPTTFIEFLYDQQKLKSYLRSYSELYTQKINDVSSNFEESIIKEIDLEKEKVTMVMYDFITNKK